MSILTPIFSVVLLYLRKQRLRLRYQLLVGEVLQDGVNGLVVGEDTSDLRRGIEALLEDRALAYRL